ncbi:polypeptide N-acetylgalactosaminyltransferase 5-like [Haliotis rufescens]|uniref:polypeptide N-acetylgalactosaminyltransferase 5-like n=1 Tax=Haliotis rufescens TaxID=6454 RepID=UPI00201F765D|nr:polypeptide N-acetylgalactosaminyltransferase 5-like [Haliotis rufescens]XP_046332992.2 polypeptide N-acetylgalactosaminyltransferase 5-like [Haliotis rufescens]XP_046332993.2 polypeptide N-acetylgalactosaminyltransferase 5-like [Haliotis rufescens]XP_046332994.2 polypeptide N-acetylgalactosaminyltransferase 5-like [Haliotis rufescens]
MIERRKQRSNGVRSLEETGGNSDLEMAKPKANAGRRRYIYLLLIVPILWFLVVLKVALFDAERGSKPASHHAAGDRAPVVMDDSYVDDVKYEEIKSWKRDDDTRDDHIVNLHADVPKKKSKMKVLQAHPGLGEGGAASIVDASLLNPTERTAFELGDSVHHFNEFVSDKISLVRSVPDFRNPECQAAFQFYPKDLPSVSVVICFYNEAWSTLLRTIHSVLNRTPANLLEEILLVDDGSNLEDLGEPLDEYTAAMPKVHVVRTNRRLGLVRARMEGIKFAKAPVLVFLDSHCECGNGWLEPLLVPIKDNPSTVVTPTIDVIDKDDFRINNADNNIGGFSAESMTFNWISVPPRINRYRTTMADPFVSPTLAGGLFAINKEYFSSIGLYDTGLEVWGGENLELSLKLWMCGGKILISPCSRVGHIFRLKSPYVNVGDTFLSKNAARVAEVWLDEYKWFHFKSNPFSPSDFGDITGAKELRSKLKCKHFDWYLENIYPELFISGSGDHFGQISHVGTGLCLSAPGWEQPLAMFTCDTGTIWESDKMLEIRHNIYCVDFYPGVHQAPSTSMCKSEQTTQVWTFKKVEGQILHQMTNTCLTVKDAKSITLEPCVPGDVSQKWSWPTNPHFQFNRTAADEMAKEAGW